MKLINLTIIFVFVLLGSSCVPEEGFLKEEESIKITGNEIDTDEEAESPSVEKSLNHVLSFEDMVEYLQIRLNNNHLDSGRSAFFTAQAPFSPNDKIIIYTQARCSGKMQEVSFEKFTPLPLTPIVNTEDKVYIYEFDSNLEFFGNIARPKPRINYSSVQSLPPYQFSIKGLKEGVMNYSFRFEREGRKSRCLSIINTEHIIRRDKPKPPTNIVISSEEDPEGELIGVESKVSFRIEGEYLGENVVGLFLKQVEGDVCRLENIIYTQELGFTPGIKIELTLSEHNVLKDLRGRVDIYAAFINPHGVVSDCYGPVFSEVIGQPVSPNIEIVRDPSNNTSNVVRRRDGKLVVTSSSKFKFSFESSVARLQPNDQIYIHRNDDCSGHKKIHIPSEDLELPTDILISDPEILPALAPDLSSTEHDYSVTVFNDFTGSLSDECNSISVVHDDMFPTFLDHNIIIKNGPSFCSEALVDGKNYTNCDDISFGFRLQDDGTWLTHYEFSTSDTCDDVTPYDGLTPDDFLDSDSGSLHSGLVRIKDLPGALYLYTTDGLGNQGCQKTNIQNDAPHDVATHTEVVTETWLYDNPSAVTADLDVSVPAGRVAVSDSPKIRTFNSLEDITIVMDKTNPSDKISYHPGTCDNLGDKLVDGKIPKENVAEEGVYPFSGVIENALRPDLVACDQLLYVYDKTSPVISNVTISAVDGDDCYIDPGGNSVVGYNTSCEQIEVHYNVRDVLNDFCHSVDDDPRCDDPFPHGKNTLVTAVKIKNLSLGDNPITIFSKDQATNESLKSFDVVRVNPPTSVSLELSKDFAPTGEPVFGPINSPSDENDDFYTGNHSQIKIQVKNSEGNDFNTATDFSNEGDTIEFFNGSGCAGVPFNVDSDASETLTLLSDGKYNYSMRIVSSIGEEGTCVDIDYAYIFDTVNPSPTTLNYLCNGLIAPVMLVSGRQYIDCSVDDDLSVRLSSGENVNRVFLDTFNPDLSADSNDPNDYKVRNNSLTTRNVSLAQFNTGFKINVLDAAGNKGELITEPVFILDYKISMSIADASNRVELPIQFYFDDIKLGLDIEVHRNAQGALSDNSFFDLLFKDPELANYPESLGAFANLDIGDFDIDGSVAGYITYSLKSASPKGNLDLVNDYNGADSVIQFDRYYIEPTFRFNLLEEGENLKKQSTSYIFDERPGFLNPFPTIADPTTFAPAVEHNEFSILSKECLSIDEATINEETDSRTFCGGYALRIEPEGTFSKDILIREIRNSTDEVLAEWIIGQEGTNEECLDIVVEPLPSESATAVRVSCGGWTDGDFDYGPDEENTGGDREKIGVRYYSKTSRSYNFGTGLKQGIDSWVRFDLATSEEDPKNYFLQKDSTIQEGITPDFNQGFIFRFWLSGHDDSKSGILNESEWTQWGTNKGHTECRALTASQKIKEGDVLIDRSVYCAGMMDNKEAIFKLLDRDYSIESSYGYGLGVSDNPSSKLGITFSKLHNGNEFGYITSLKSYRLDNLQNMIHFFLGGSTGYNFPEPATTGTGFLFPQASPNVSRNAFIGMLRYQHTADLNKLFENTELDHSSPSATRTQYWFNALSFLERSDSKIKNFDGDDSCEDIMVIGSKGDVGYTSYDYLPNERTISGVRGIACTGYTKRNLDSGLSSFLENSNEDNKDRNESDGFIWLTGVQWNDDLNVWNNQIIFSKQLHYDVDINGIGDREMESNGNQRCNSLALHVPESDRSGLHNPSMFICGGSSDLLNVSYSRNGIKSNEVYKNESPNNGISPEQMSLMNSPTHDTSWPSSTVMLWGVTFLEDDSAGNILGAKGETKYLKSLPNLVREEQSNYVVEPSTSVDHNHSVGSHLDAYSSCYDFHKDKVGAVAEFYTNSLDFSQHFLIHPYYDINDTGEPIFYCAGGDKNVVTNLKPESIKRDSIAFPIIIFDPAP